MSVDSTSGQGGAGVVIADADFGTAPASGDMGRDVAGLVFARLSVLPALLATPWLTAGFLLLAFGEFTPVPVTGLAAVLAIPVLYYGLRAVPPLPRPEARALRIPSGRPPGRTPWWTVAAVLAITMAFLADQVVYHSQFVLTSRDPGAYYQFAAWIAGHRSLPIPKEASLFGGSHRGSLLFARTLPYQVGNSIVLPFMAGLPMVLAGVMWAAGQHAALLAAPVLGALAVLTFAGLAARLIGARWAALAALIVAVSLPMQFTSRSVYSEPLAEILLLGGLSIVIDSLRDHAADAGPASAAVRRHARTAAAMGGFFMGLTILVRIDAASGILPVIPFCGALFVRRRPQAAPLAIGLAAGVAIGLIEGLVFSWTYLMYTNRASVLPLAGIAALVLAATAAGTLFYRHRQLPRWWGWLHKAAPAAPFLIITAFAVRPHIQHVWQADLNGHLVRTHAEISLDWVNWYLGVPVILLATIGAAQLARAILRGQNQPWVLPLMVLAWATVTVLYRPGIVPDQPWASRRLVPEVMPGFIILAVWALARGSDWMRHRWHLGVPRNVLMGLCVLLVVAPAVVTNWGLDLSASPGISLRADGLADKRTYQGELSWTERLCTILPPRSAVVFLSDDLDFRWEGGEVRNICGIPVALYVPPGGNKSARISDKPGVLSVLRDIQRAGRVPVLLSRGKRILRPYKANGTEKQVPTLYTSQDAQPVYNVPTNPAPITINLWMWTPSHSLTSVPAYARIRSRRPAQ